MSASGPNAGSPDAHDTMSSLRPTSSLVAGPARRAVSSDQRICTTVTRERSPSGSRVEADSQPVQGHLGVVVEQDQHLALPRAQAGVARAGEAQVARLRQHPHGRSNKLFRRPHRRHNVVIPTTK